MDILKDFLVQLPLWARTIAYIIGIIVWTWFIFFYPVLKDTPPKASTGNMETPNIKVEKVEGDFVVGDKKIFYSEVKKADSIIRTLELRVMLDAIVPQGKNIEEGASVGLASVLGLFSYDKTRYRFITDYKFSVSKIELGKQRLLLVYQAESPEQIIGKKLDLLKDIDRLVVNYSDFLKTIVD